MILYFLIVILLFDGKNPARAFALSISTYAKNVPKKQKADETDKIVSHVCQKRFIMMTGAGKHHVVYFFSDIAS
nr:hypothetical protein [Prevotella sp.]